MAEKLDELRRANAELAEARERAESLSRDPESLGLASA
jgi:hypothetical protein